MYDNVCDDWFVGGDTRKIFPDITYGTLSTEMEITEISGFSFQENSRKNHVGLIVTNYTQ